ncbi:hypothetical protein HMPREF9056_00636 [Actinomyces sp. oral taxon 170 str. F0386]|nr:hypothetical protein HMPREF9056_00636 [Actinomyces sp. oral taxon 170 str. F0386]
MTSLSSERAQDDIRLTVDIDNRPVVEKGQGTLPGDGPETA